MIAWNPVGAGSQNIVNSTGSALVKLKLLSDGIAQLLSKRTGLYFSGKSSVSYVFSISIDLAVNYSLSVEPQSQPTLIG